MALNSVLPFYAKRKTCCCYFVTFNKCLKQQLDPKLIFATNVFIIDEKVKMQKAVRSNKALYKLVDIM